jgi:hypothetical protein
MWKTRYCRLPGGRYKNYVLYDFVLNKAANWTNKRIEKYLERDYCD